MGREAPKELRDERRRCWDGEMERECIRESALEKDDREAGISMVLGCSSLSLERS